MSKKDKKIEIQLTDSAVTIGQAKVNGYALVIGKKTVGEIAELDGKFAVIKDGQVDTFFKTLEKAIENVIENYNLNH